MNQNQSIPYKILCIASHPVQYSAPFFRYIAQEESQIDLLVSYCSLQGVKKGFDRGFNMEVQWDIPLLDGYSWVELPNQSLDPGLSKFWGLLNLQIWQTIRNGKYDAIIILTGYTYASFWIALLAAKISGVPIFFGTDAHEINPKNRKKWKLNLKKIVLPFIFKLADIVTVVSSGGVKLMKSLGISEDKIYLTPYAVDNQWWLSQAKQINCNLVRKSWNIPEEASVILFCAKLQPWKSPEDVLLAFAKANLSQAYLVFAGEGPLRQLLEQKAKELNIAEKVRFLGFVNQSKLPAVYSTADLFVLPSEHEPFGLVVNEAMLCGCPVIVTDKVGAGYDLVTTGETGYVYPCHDIKALSSIFKELIVQPELIQQMSKNAIKRMETWSYKESISSLLEALDICAEKQAKSRKAKSTFFKI